MSTLATRLSFSMVAVAAATAMLIGWGLDQRVRSVLEPTELSHEQEVARRLARGLQAQVENLRSDVVLMGEAAPVHAFLEAQAQHAPESPALRAAVTQFFESLLRARPGYLQARLIAAADPGHELIRVDRQAFGEAVRVVPEAELQEKGHRPYLPATLSMRPLMIYISPIEANQEHRRVVEPKVLVIPPGAPVLDADGQVVSALMINVDLNEALAEIRRTTPTGSEAFLVDEAGHFLLHPTHEPTLSATTAADAQLLAEFQTLRSTEAAKPIARHMVGPDGGLWATAGFPFDLLGGPRLVLISRTPSSGATALSRAHQGAFVFALVAALGAALMAFLLARSITQPLAKMSEAALGFVENQNPALPTEEAGEVGILARAFENMASTIRERSAFLERQELRFRRVVEGAPSALVIANRNQAVILANRQAELLFGVSHETLLGRQLSSMVAEEHQSQLLDFIEMSTAARDGETHLAPFKSWVFQPNGSRATVMVTLTALELPEGHGTLMSMLDVTDREFAEERFRLVVEAAPSGMIMANDKGEITMVNRRAEALFGYADGELLGRPLDCLIPARFAAEHPHHVAAFFSSPRVREMGTGPDITAVSKSGREIPVEIGLNTLRTPEGIQTLASIVDITERRRVADELARSNADLEQFAYVASHDLQEPLRMVASFTELLGQRYEGKLDEKADKYIFYAVDGAKRMQRLITDLLAYSRVGSQGKPLHPIASEVVVKRVIATLGRQIKESNGTVECDALPEVLADEGQLTQLFQNLIGNGLKFHGERAPVVRVSADFEADHWVFHVQDNGIGIDMKSADRIFQMFQRLQTRTEFEGSGIGLSIAKRIVERHGGRIWVDSTLGEGTTFHFTLRPTPTPTRV